MLSEEHKAKISASLIGNKRALGHRHDKETRERISRSHAGVPLAPAHRATLLGNKHRLGIPHSQETRAKMSASRIGKKNGNWRGGVTPANRAIRTSARMKTWRNAVFLRDDFTCLKCSARGVKLNADHIKPFALFPELRFELSNGRTLCEPCHRKTDTFGGRPKHI